MHVVLLAAQSLDGRITRQAQAGDAFTSATDKAHFSAALRACDACVMGRATYAESKDRLRPDRLPGLRRVVWTRSPAAYADRVVPGVLEFTAETPAHIFERLRNDGRRRCALLGGAQLNTAWLRAGLVDELCITVESALFSSGTPLTNDLDVALSLIDVTPLATDGPLVIRYSVQK